MNLPHSPRSGSALLLSLIAAAGLSATSLFAQSVATAPVGAVTTSLPAGFSLVGLTLVNPATYSGAISSNTATQVTASGTPSFASLDASAFYYVEVTSGLFEGDRFDVDTGATITAGNGNLIIRTDTGNNTVALSNNVLNGANFVLRKHITLNALAASVSPAFVGNNSSANADQVLFYNRGTNSFDTYFLRLDNVTWRKLGFTDSVGATTIIPPGVGVFVRKASAATTLTQVGEVRSNAFALPVGTGLSLMAAGYPVSYSPTAFGGTAANGWTGNNSSGTADQILTFSNATNSYVTYFLRLDGLTWRQLGFTDDVRNTNIVAFDSAFWFKRANADSNYALAKPF